jgi:serine/threonine protein phosphatase PrpC
LFTVTQVKTRLLECEELALLGVFDGHGPEGARCAGRAAAKFDKYLTEQVKRYLFFSIMTINIIVHT